MVLIQGRNTSGRETPGEDVLQEVGILTGQGQQSRKTPGEYGPLEEACTYLRRWPENPGRAAPHWSRKDEDPGHQGEPLPRDRTTGLTGPRPVVEKPRVEGSLP